MKTILIATDFTEASRNAAVYGLELAVAFNATVVLFSSYQEIPVPVTESPVIVTPADMKKYIQQLLEQEVKIINTGSRVAIETLTREGAAADTILEIAAEKNAGLIIAGMKEGGKGIRKMLGSTATALAGKTRIPLVIVPEKARYVEVSSIALANESDLDPHADNHMLDLIQEITARFHSKVYLVRVARDRVKAAYETLNRPFKLIRMMHTPGLPYGTIEGRNIPEALNHFIEGYHINMLAMLPHHRSLFEKWFSKSTTRSMAFETHIPLLILPELRAKKTGHKRVEKETLL